MLALSNDHQSAKAHQKAAKVGIVHACRMALRLQLCAGETLNARYSPACPPMVRLLGRQARQSDDGSLSLKHGCDTECKVGIAELMYPLGSMFFHVFQSDINLCRNHVVRNEYR
jgi:hypothetical protein